MDLSTIELKGCYQPTGRVKNRCGAAPYVDALQQQASGLRAFSLALHTFKDNRFAVRGAGEIELAVEAGARARMAGGTVAAGLDDEPQHVLIAIDADFGDAQNVAALLALFPKAAARTAPEGCLAGG